MKPFLLTISSYGRSVTVLIYCQYLGEKPLVPESVVNDLCQYLGIKTGQTFSFWRDSRATLRSIWNVSFLVDQFNHWLLAIQGVVSWWHIEYFDVLQFVAREISSWWICDCHVWWYACKNHELKMQCGWIDTTRYHRIISKWKADDRIVLPIRARLHPARVNYVEINRSLASWS